MAEKRDTNHEEGRVSALGAATKNSERGNLGGGGELLKNNHVRYERYRSKNRGGTNER